MNQPALCLKQLCWEPLLNPAEKKVLPKRRDPNGCGESPSCLRARLQRVLKKSVLLKGTASAVPKALCLQRGFSRWGTFFISRGHFFSTLFSRAVKLAAKRPSALPKAGAKPEGRSD